MGSATKTKVVQSNFANGVVSPRLRWTTNEEIFRSSAQKIVNAKVGNYGEIVRREGLVLGQLGVGSECYGFTVQDLYDGTTKHLALTAFPDGNFWVFEIAALLGSVNNDELTTVLTSEDMQNASLGYASEITVEEPREENPEASTTKTATLTDPNTGRYEWTYEVKQRLSAFTGSYETQNDDNIYSAETLGAGAQLGFAPLFASPSKSGAMPWGLSFNPDGEFEAVYTVTEQDVAEKASFFVKATCPQHSANGGEVRFDRTNFVSADGTQYRPTNLKWIFPYWNEPPTGIYKITLTWVKERGDIETVLGKREITGSFESVLEYVLHTAWKNEDATYNKKLTVSGRLRHANYAGEEYFCGKNQAPFKVSLNNGVYSVGVLTYEIPPFNDTVVGSKNKLSLKKVEINGVGYAIVTLPKEMRISRFDSLKLINYDAVSNFRKKLKYKQDGTAADGNLAGWESEMLPAFGNVQLKTEGSYWAGTITLYERMLLEDGSYEDVDLGQIVAGGLASTMTLSASITRLNSRVYAKLTYFADAKEYMQENGGVTPSDEYKDEGVTVSLQVSGSQEVFCFPVNGEPPSSIANSYPSLGYKEQRLVWRCDTPITSPFEHTNGTVSTKDKGFTTNSFATSIIRNSLGDYPRTICFFQDRLVFGGTDANPKRLFMSKTGNPRNFQLGVNDDDALSTTVSGSDLEEIRWMCSREGLIVGTSRREYTLRGSTSTAVTPTSIKVAKPSGESAYTSANIECQNLESGVACVRGSELELLMYRYSTETYTYLPKTLNPLNREVFEAEGGIKDFAVCSRPETEVWVLFNSGKAANLRVTESVTNGWTVMEFPQAAIGIFTEHLEERDIPCFVFAADGGAKVGFFQSDAFVVGKTKRGTADYLRRQQVAEHPYEDYDSSKKEAFPFETAIALHPWWTNAGDALGARVVPVKTSLCFCEARRFTASYSEDGGENEENIVFDAKGERKPISYAEYELRKQGRWDDKAMLTIRTQDNHPFVLSVVRTKLTIGE